jgi:argininosuccinate lyase
MREVIDEGMSPYFLNDVEYPELVKDYHANFHEAIVVQRAYAIMLVKTGIVDAGSGKKILEGLSCVEGTLKAEDLKAEYEDMYFNIEKALIAKIGVKAGGKLHTGRSRNDIGSTLNRMHLRKSILLVIEKLIALQEVVLRKAKDNRDVIMTGYTHMQPAQPISLGHYYTAILGALGRDFARLVAAYANTNHCPYGAAAFAGSSFPVDRGMLADLLGFDGILENSLDCIASKDFLLETEMAYVNMGVTVSRIAQDHYFWSTNEFGILKVGGQVAVCSSIMPQKNNPVGFEYCKSKSAHSMGALVGSMAALKNTPFSNNIDIHEAFWLYDEGCTETMKVLGMLAESITYSEIDTEKAYESAKRNFCTVTALADDLVRTQGVSFNEAHRIVGTMVRTVLENKNGIDGMNSRLLAKTARDVIGRSIDLTDEAIRLDLEPYNNVQQKKTIGGPSVESVAKMIEKADESLSMERTWLANAISSVERGYAMLEKEECAIRGMKERAAPSLFEKKTAR